MMNVNDLWVIGLPPKLWTRIVTFVCALTLLVVWLQSGSAPSPIWWVGTAFVVLIEGLVEFALSQFQAHRSKRRINFERYRDVLLKETRNFEQIRDAQETGRTFSGLHQKAVEVYSFENAGEVLDRLKAYWAYRRLARIGLAQNENNQARSLREIEVVPLVRTIDQLLRRLNAELQRDG